MMNNIPFWLNFDEGRVIMNGSAVYFTETHLKDHTSTTPDCKSVVRQAQHRPWQHPRGNWPEQQCFGGKTGKQFLSVCYEH